LVFLIFLVVTTFLFGLYLSKVAFLLTTLVLILLLPIAHPMMFILLMFNRVKWPPTSRYTPSGPLLHRLVLKQVVNVIVRVKVYFVVGTVVFGLVHGGLASTGTLQLLGIPAG